MRNKKKKEKKERDQNQRQNRDPVILSPSRKSFADNLWLIFRHLCVHFPMYLCLCLCVGGGGSSKTKWGGGWVKAASFSGKILLIYWKMSKNVFFTVLQFPGNCWLIRILGPCVKQWGVIDGIHSQHSSMWLIESRASFETCIYYCFSSHSKWKRTYSVWNPVWIFVERFSLSAMCQLQLLTSNLATLN